MGNGFYPNGQEKSFMEDWNSTQIPPACLHYSSNLKDRAAKGRELYVLSEKLKLLIIASMLEIVGFPDENRTKRWEHN